MPFIIKMVESFTVTGRTPVINTKHRITMIDQMLHHRTVALAGLPARTTVDPDNTGDFVAATGLLRFIQ